MRALILITALLAWGGSSAQAQKPNERKGFWIGFGLGDGSAGADCQTLCTDNRSSGPSGYFRLGGTLSRKVLMGFETNVWGHSSGGIDESMGFGSLVVLWYPSRTGALYLKFGFGGMTYTENDGANEITATAPSGSLGIGYEFRVGRNMSLVPYLNSLASSAVLTHLNGVPVTTGEDITLNLVQLGLGVTWH